MHLSLTTSGLLDPKWLDSWVPEKRRAIRKAVESAMKTVGREMADTARSQMQSAFKVRKAGFLKSMRSKVYAGSPERFPALLIGSKIAWLGLHMKGGTVMAFVIFRTPSILFSLSTHFLPPNAENKIA